MSFSRTVILLVPLCLCAQTPPPPQPPKPAPATQPTVTMTMENVGQPPPNVPPDRVVLTVGDATITAAQFNAMIEALPEQYRNAARGAGRKQFADNITRTLVVAQEGKRRKLDENPDYKTQLMFQAANMLAFRAYQEISKEVTVDRAALQKAYDERKNEFETLRARQILIRMQGSTIPVKPGQKDLTEAEALAKATDLRKKLVEGGDFATIAMAESDDPRTATKGGDLGTIRKGMNVPSFDQAAFAMKAGDLSEPVKSNLGYHLILVEAHDIKSLDDVKAQLEAPLRQPLAQKAVEEMQKKVNVVLDPEFFNMAKQ